MVTRERLYSADDLWELSHQPENEGQRLELSEGELIVMSPAGGKHGKLALRLGRYIGNFVEAHNLGEATAAETGFILHKDPDGRDTVRAPDVGFISRERVPEGGLPERYIPLAPDLAVEVVSPTDDAEEVFRKVQEYLRYGTRLVWVAYPKSRSLVAHTPAETKTSGVEGILEGGEVLPGFSLPLRDIFAE